MNKCKKCGEEFEAIRSTAQFCSNKCKLAYHREPLSVSNETLKEVSVSTPKMTHEEAAKIVDAEMAKRPPLLAGASKKMVENIMMVRNMVKEIKIKNLLNGEKDKTS